MGCNGFVLLCGPIFSRHVDRCINQHTDRASVDISADTQSICHRTCRSMRGRHLVTMSVDTRSIPQVLHYDELSGAYRLTVSGISVECQWHIGQLLVAYQSTVSGISVECQWYIGQLSVAYRSTVSIVFC